MTHTEEWLFSPWHTASVQASQLEIDFNRRIVPAESLVCKTPTWRHMENQCALSDKSYAQTLGSANFIELRGVIWISWYPVETHNFGLILMSTGIYIPTMSFQDVFWATRDISKITCAVMNQNTNHPAKTRALEPSTMSCAQNASMSSSCRHAAHIQFGSTCFGYVLLRENKYCKCHGQDMINHGSDILWSSV
jgi:hypothetical protein